ncbi:MAG: DegT/DnrJ/EryC1/StrS family aminotransferase [Deltaproteobacteria bacterium]|nr:DegT/DnrJ/EryC1/StrS family aminotransferase [Deltaproteobacteria bacterium]
MEVPLLDLKKQYESIKPSIMAATEEVYNSQQFILGPKVKELEEKVATYCHCRFAVGVSSGTDALLISLMTSGVKPGDFVITTPYTFFATVGCISRVGGVPVFIDIEADTFNMDPVKLKTTLAAMGEKQIAKVKAIVPIHLFGQCADMEPILKTASEHRLEVIEDAAQAIGSEYAFRDGTVKRAGSMGNYGCFSFFPSKNLGAFGDGGMVITNSQEIYDQLYMMRGHGAKPKYYHRVIGGNFRLDTLQAAILTVKLTHLDEWISGRQENAALYRSLFKKGGVEELIMPLEKGKRHIYNQFVVMVKKGRNELREFLKSKGVGSEVYYPIPLHIQECFRHYGYREEDFPISVDAAKKSLALPIFPELTEGQISYVVDKIKEFFYRRP